MWVSEVMGGLVVAVDEHPEQVDSVVFVSHGASRRLAA